MIEICDKGCENLVAGIIGRAVNDIVEAKLRLDWLQDTDKAIIKIIKSDSKNNPQINTLDQAFVKLQWKIDQEKKKYNNAVAFINGDYYKELTSVASDYMLAKAQELYEEKVKERDEKEALEKQENAKKKHKKKEEAED